MNRGFAADAACYSGKQLRVTLVAEEFSPYDRHRVIGAQIGNFKIVKQLGAGGMGVVYLGEHDTVGTRVAIKMLLPEISANKAVVDRFFNEAVAAGKVQHVGIAKVFDVGFIPPTGRAYLIMEYLPGETLHARIRSLGRLAVPHVAEIGKQICAVLDAVHKAGIVHRDLKPDNVFLVPDDEIGERVRLVDFGIAKLSTVAGNLTSTSFAMGTPTYMAPEQWRNSKTVDWRADAYSLGCMTYEMVTGQPPFKYETIGEACAKHLAEEPAPLATHVDVPPALQSLVGALLAKQPGDRPASMRDIGLAFAQLAAPPVVPVVAAVHAISSPLPHPSEAATVQAPHRPSDAATVLASFDAATMPAEAPPLRPSDAATVPASHQPLEAPTVPRRPTPRMIPIPQATLPMVQPAVPVIPRPAHNRARWQLGIAAVLIAGGATVAAVVSRDRTSPPSTAPDAASPSSPQRGSPAPAEPSGSSASNTSVPSTGSNAIDSSLPKAIDGTMVSRVLTPVKEAVRGCGDKAIEKGVVKIAVTVAPDGSISSAVIDRSPDEGLGRCVAGEIMRARFPATQTGGSFVYPFIF